MKLIAIVGQTSSGKSDLGVYLARKFDGEIVSADSRQIYKGLNLASGKITRKEMRDIPHHLLDIVSTRSTYTVSKYKKKAVNTIKDIYKQNKLPFLVGGSPFYIYSVIDNLTFPEIKADPIFRTKLEKLSIKTLLNRLQKLDSKRAETIETKNKRRLIRALEIIHTTGLPVPEQLKTTSLFDTLLIGIKKNKEQLNKNIKKRIDVRIKQGMIKEIKKLHTEGVSYKRLEELGLEPKYISLYLKGDLTKEEMRVKLLSSTIKFSKRQLTWFKKDKRIHWIENKKQSEILIREFLRK